ncbi:O-methyltransferase [Hoyosella sp. G463]|uniref:O-methyltransferase n=1 Tax=Lolliginicoccus lacisalsi TaxID=2742202 RepID=A0A927JA20_9ACTN|nr:O-methyltransferase [Lolliginicoccus lacisalsi]MBD8505463.1 O-methyltransferase [Lolliginicoccus lacisalsi]
MVSANHPLGLPADVDAVEHLITELVVTPDERAEHAARRAMDAGLPPIEVAPNHGKLLHLLVAMSGARRVLEIGTLAGYSTIWMASALPPGGKLVTIDNEPRHARIAAENIAEAGLSDAVDLRIGDATTILEELARSAPTADSFDFVFIDADKENIPEYLRLALSLCGDGAVVVLDNAVWHGAIVDAADHAAQGIRAGLELLGSEPRFDATVIQTVGTKGWDGFAIARVRSARRQGEPGNGSVAG